MALGKYASLHFGDSNLSRLQSQTKSVLDAITSLPILDGTLLEGVAVVSGSNSINHKLNRKIRGYIVVSKSANITHYDNIASDPSNLDTTLTLTCSGTATLKLWVF
jgi:hypothetical protein